MLLQELGKLSEAERNRMPTSVPAPDALGFITMNSPYGELRAPGPLVAYPKRQTPGIAGTPRTVRSDGLVTPKNGDVYLIPITMESGPTTCSTRAAENPASFIQAMHSARV